MKSFEVGDTFTLARYGLRVEWGFQNARSRKRLKNSRQIQIRLGKVSQSWISAPDVRLVHRSSFPVSCGGHHAQGFESQGEFV